MLNMKIKDGQFDTAFYLTLVDIAMKAAEVGADIVTIRGPEFGGMSFECTMAFEPILKKEEE